MAEDHRTPYPVQLLQPVISDPEVMERFRTCMELCDLAFELKRQALRREDPEADEDTIQERMDAWVRHRPGAEYGDASGPGFVSMTWDEWVAKRRAREAAEAAESAVQEDSAS